MVGTGDFLDVFFPKHLGAPIDQDPFVPGVDEQDLVGTAAVAPVGFIP
jgi:hypothetical protein